VDNCVDELLHYTVNSSRLRVQAVDDSAAVFQYPAGNDVVELVFVADIEDTNLLLVVVDGRRSVAETVGTSHRQVVTQFYIALCYLDNFVMWDFVFGLCMCFFVRRTSHKVR